MAEKAALIQTVQRGVYKVTWTGIGATSADDTGAAVHVPGGKMGSVTVQVKGTFAGSTLTMQGSNDGGTSYDAVNDSRGEGNSMAYTAQDTKIAAELPDLIRPALTSGSSSNLTVIAIIRKG